MIKIEQDQVLKDEPGIKVSVPTGEYNETDLIECYAEGADPAKPTLMYQAQFIVFGRAVYQQSEDLTEEQVDALLNGMAPELVINNRKMIEGKMPSAKYSGAIVKRNGSMTKRELRKDIQELKQKMRAQLNGLTDETSAIGTATSTDPTIKTKEQIKEEKRLKKLEEEAKAKAEAEARAKAEAEANVNNNSGAGTIINGSSADYGTSTTTNGGVNTSTTTSTGTGNGTTTPSVANVVSKVKRRIIKRLLDA